MSEYKPTNRRPIADVFRGTARGAVNFCVAADIHPDTISYFSVVAAALAGLAFWQSGRYPLLLVVAPAFCYLRLYCNMLDGMVALASKKASLRGEILNDVPDRISDVLIFVGVAHSGLCHAWLGYWGAIAALLVAYIGVFGQAVGVQREFSGVMSKPWRMVGLHVGAWIALGCYWLGRAPAPAGLSVMDWTLLAILAGCAQSFCIRLARIMAALDAKKAKG